MRMVIIGDNHRDLWHHQARANLHDCTGDLIQSSITKQAIGLQYMAFVPIVPTIDKDKAAIRRLDSANILDRSIKPLSKCAQGEAAINQRLSQCVIATMASQCDAMKCGRACFASTGDSLSSNNGIGNEPDSVFIYGSKLTSLTGNGL